ncbi:glycosyltransferase [Anaerovorax odorimutans]|uniref:Glycosyltransferase n=1 Tax=Anaerovorax odorimutans TaxID=109327 RepID=A0ABT1RPU7_9FIRM|nr:glycosyltransferase [Anaerovorax odorimutans]MCQ4637212.1 glycosyltransferase [Anaerovorax odorimutans]
METKYFDRISEGYKGELGTEVMEQARKRIDWICAKTKGKTVLDVGCSQGITSILLGRCGKKVIGIDSEISRIQYAEKELKEEPELKTNVSFLCDDFLDCKFEKKFDCIIMGEFLEHVFDPSLFLDKAMSFLEENGRLIVTVPFGINPFPDHKRTYYFAELFYQINERICVNDVCFFGGWIGFVADKKIQGSDIEINRDLVRKLENSFFYVENKKQLRIDQLASQHDEIKAKLEEVNQQVEQLKKKVSELDEKKETVNELTLKLQKVSWEAEHYKNESASKEETFLLINQELEAARTYIKELSKDKEEKGGKIEGLYEELERAEKRFRLMSQTMSDIQVEREQKKQEVERLSAIDKKLQHELKAAYIKLNNAEKTIKDLTAESAEQDKKIDKMHKELQKTREDVDATTIELNSRQMALNGIMTDLTTKEEILKKYKQEIDDINSKFIKEKKNLQTEKASLERKCKEMNSLLYKAKKLNTAYERLIEVKVYNYLRHLKRKLLQKLKKETKEELSVESNNVMQHLTESGKMAEEDLFSESKLKEIEREAEYLRLLKKAELIPDSNGQRYYKKIDIRIGIICDQIFYDSFYSAADFIYISPDNWEDILSEIDYLLILSTWNGLHNNEWSGIATEGTNRRKRVNEIIRNAKKRDIITIFYSKEDPGHYNDYLSIAKQCDYIFTTEIDVVEAYKKDCGNENVFTLQFGINPVFHNPIGIKNVEKESGVIFSGSWMKRIENRCSDLSMLFDGLIKEDIELKIIDRNYDFHSDERYAYPEKYFRHAYKSIPHDKLQKVHKLFDWAININNIKYSQTMFANRVYELQACGNLLLSNYSVGVNSCSPTVFLIFNEDEIKNIIKNMNEEEIYEHQVFGIRSVMSEHTCYERIFEMMRHVKEAMPLMIKRKVAVIIEKESQCLIDMFNCQTYEEKVLFHINDVTDRSLEDIDIITFFSDEVEYGAFYLEDMINGFKYTDSDYITKHTYIKNGELAGTGEEHSYTTRMNNKYMTVFWKESFEVDKLLNLHGVQNIPKGYCIDHFNCRQINSEDKPRSNYKLSVIIPIYNNGNHLYGKAFSSLVRSSMFDDMEIIMVDDGSTDNFTPKMINYLSQRYSNVKTFLFNDGGSGSASRPRNKGIELSTTEYITFLDPDNEAVNNAYYKLYRQIRGKNYDFICGSSMYAGENCWISDFYKSYMHKKYKNGIVRSGGGKKLLVDTNFSGISMQAAIVKKQFLKQYDLYQINGAAGEDTLSSWEWFTCADTFEINSTMAHIYYAARSGSIVNSINISFYKKYFAIEEPRKSFLEQHGLLNDYMNKKFNSYFENWTLQHLIYLKGNDIEASIIIVKKIFDLYRDNYNGKSEIINHFVDLCDRKELIKAQEYIKDIFQKN